MAPPPEPPAQPPAPIIEHTENKFYLPGSRPGKKGAWSEGAIDIASYSKDQRVKIIETSIALLDQTEANYMSQIADEKQFLTRKSLARADSKGEADKARANIKKLESAIAKTRNFKQKLIAEKTRLQNSR
jgi:hypothetical protein